MTRNPAALIGATLLLVAAGFALGFLVGQRRVIEEGRPTTPDAPGSPHRSTPLPALSRGDRSDGASADDDRTKLRERIVELESQLRVAREESARKPTPEADADIARLALEDLLSMELGGDRNPERLRSLIDHLARLNERTAAYFITQFRGAQADKELDERKKVALQLALMSGGPDAADFIQQLLTDPTLDPDLRNRLLSELVPSGGSFFSIRRLPVGESLASTATMMTHSDKFDDRRAGASLLGGVRSAASRGELIRLLQDSDEIVRESAARSLGIIGDPATKKILEAYAAQTADEGLRKAAVTAIKEIEGQ